MKKASGSDLKPDAACSLGQALGEGAEPGVGLRGCGQGVGLRWVEPGVGGSERRGSAEGQPGVGPLSWAVGRPAWPALPSALWAQDTALEPRGPGPRLRSTLPPPCPHPGSLWLTWPRLPFAPRLTVAHPLPLSAGLGRVGAGGREGSRAWGGGRLPHGPHWGLPSLGWVGALLEWPPDLLAWCPRGPRFCPLLQWL